jgi:hypothetical protein
MRKAARRRIRHRADYLVELSFSDPEKFEAEWNERMLSWVEEIEDRARVLQNEGLRYGRPVFEIADRAISAIQRCSPQARQRHLKSTIDLFEHLCGVRVAAAMDRRLYQTNMMDPERFQSKKHRSRKEADGWK